MNLEKVLSAYVECALWSSTNDDGEPLDNGYTMADLDSGLLAKLRKDCAEFVAQNEEALLTWNGETSVEAQTGHDLWLTQNRHGAGFWEGEWGSVGEQLTERAHELGEINLYVGDDGKIYG